MLYRWLIIAIAFSLILNYESVSGIKKKQKISASSIYCDTYHSNTDDMNCYFVNQVDLVLLDEEQTII